MSFALPAADNRTGPPDPGDRSAGPDDLRRVFRRHAAAVAVITASHRGFPFGLLVTSLASVSASPPLISFNVARTSSSWPALAGAEHLGVHVLGEDQEDLAARFARKGADRFATPTSWQSGPHGTPVIDGTAAWAVAQVEHRFEAGDHVIVVARLSQVKTRDHAHPLVHHDGHYRRVASSARPEAGAATSRLTVVRTEGEP
jgi:flavin reductase (DIM6/NTAB) family NADH-FMN oxidoreductase RutF